MEKSFITLRVCVLFFAPKCFLLPPVLSSQNSPTACQPPWCCSSGPLSRVAFLPGLRLTGFYLLSSSSGFFFYLDLPLTPSSEPFQQLQFRLPLRFLAFFIDIYVLYMSHLLDFPHVLFCFLRAYASLLLQSHLLDWRDGPAFKNPYRGPVGF